MDLKFYYQDHEIVFSKDEEVMVNATEMSSAIGRQAQGKRAKEFLENKSTIAFIDALEKKYFPESGGGNSPRQNLEALDSRILKVVANGRNAGTWMHRKLAIKFAAWLSPEFELWVIDTIDEILFGNQFAAVRHWYDETHQINNRALVIKREQGRIKRLIKDRPAVKERSRLLGAIRKDNKTLRGIEQEIRLSTQVFVSAGAQELEDLVNQRKELATKIRQLREELKAVEEEYMKMSEVITLTELTAELKGNTARKTRLTKELYQGQLVPAN